MRVLGIDPGSRITGLGVVESSKNGLHSVFHESVKLKDPSLPNRLGSIYQRVAQVIAEFNPDLVAVEQVFISKNAKSALVLGQARGGAICSAVNAGCVVTEYSAKQIKQAVVGSGGASKDQVQHMVRVLLGLRTQPGEDAADALACAICHIHIAQVEARLNRAAAAQ
ncbi:MAG: crossover junction endodeoxyribonuclease RuvC [bacterium]